MSPARLKGDWTSWRDKPYVKDAKTEERRQQGEKWSALAEWIRKHGGVVTSLPNNKTLRIEIAKELSAKLTEELVALGYAVARAAWTRFCAAVTALSADEARGLWATAQAQASEALCR
jgi:hypothetical protein